MLPLSIHTAELQNSMYMMCITSHCIAHNTTKTEIGVSRNLETSGIMNDNKFNVVRPEITVGNTIY